MAMCVILVVAVAPCQCFDPAGSTRHRLRGILGLDDPIVDSSRSQPSRSASDPAGGCAMPSERRPRTYAAVRHARRRVSVQQGFNAHGPCEGLGWSLPGRLGATSRDPDCLRRPARSRSEQSNRHDRCHEQCHFGSPDWVSSGTAFRSASAACVSSRGVQSSVSGVTGSSRMRLPVAWKTAFTIAGGTPTIAISPTPFTPSGFT